ncbi:hypothetical protein MMPV_007411 [Pyropia vietnamensis]
MPSTTDAITRRNEAELRTGAAFHPPASWHAEFAASPWVYVGNLPSGATEGDVLAVAEQVGTAAAIRLARDPSTGARRGFGWLQYVDPRSCVLAVDNLGGVLIGGRPLVVDHVKEYRPGPVGEDGSPAEMDLLEGGEAQRRELGHERGEGSPPRSPSSRREQRQRHRRRRRSRERAEDPDERRQRRVLRRLERMRQAERDEDTAATGAAGGGSSAGKGAASGVGSGGNSSGRVGDSGGGGGDGGGGDGDGGGGDGDGGTAIERGTAIDVVDRPPTGEVADAPTTGFRDVADADAGGDSGGHPRMARPAEAGPVDHAAGRAPHPAASSSSAAAAVAAAAAAEAVARRERKAQRAAVRAAREARRAAGQRGAGGGGRAATAP